MRRSSTCELLLAVTAFSALVGRCSGLLASWLSTEGLLRFEEPRATGFEDLLLAETAEAKSVCALGALRDFEKGEALFDLRAGACLTAAAVYADKEIGKELGAIAAAVGPGFDVVALATFLAAERARGFLQESVGRFDRLGATPELSAWSPLTAAHWAQEDASPAPPNDPELEPVIAQGVEIALPIIERVARRAWTQKASYLAAKPPVASSTDEWMIAAMTDDNEGYSRGELISILRTSFSIVLARQWSEPPPYLDGRSEQPERWGWAADAPSGPALLPPVAGVLVAVPQPRAADDSMTNALLGVPPPPENGNLGEGVCLRCVARRDIKAGETVLSTL